MGVQHTSGPWNQFDDGGSTGTMSYGRGYADCVWGPEGPGHGVIADCSPNGQAPTDETIANARLIAAAPDLLAALKGLETIVSEIHAKWDEGMRAGKLLIALMDPSLRYRADVTAIHAAIAKAEGRA